MEGCRFSAAIARYDRYHQLPDAKSESWFFQLHYCVLNKGDGQ